MLVKECHLCYAYSMHNMLYDINICLREMDFCLLYLSSVFLTVIFSPHFFLSQIYVQPNFTHDMEQANYSRRAILSPCEIRSKKVPWVTKMTSQTAGVLKIIPLHQLVHEMSSKNKKNKALVNVKPPQPLYHSCTVLKCHTRDSSRTKSVSTQAKEVHVQDSYLPKPICNFA